MQQRSTNRSSTNGDNNQTHTIQLRQGTNGGAMATSQSGITLSPTEQSFHSISLANHGATSAKPPIQSKQQTNEKSIEAQDLSVANSLGQQYHSVKQLECTPSGSQGASALMVVDSDNCIDPRALTAHKSNRIQQQISDVPQQDNDNSDAKSEQLQSITLEEKKGNEASSTNAVNGRRSNVRHRIRR